MDCPVDRKQLLSLILKIYITNKIVDQEEISVKVYLSFAFLKCNLNSTNSRSIILLFIKYQIKKF